MIQIPSESYIITCQIKLLEALFEFALKNDYNTSSLKNILIRLLSNSEIYSKLFLENKKILLLLSKVIQKFIEYEDIDESAIKKKVTIKKNICNINILEILIKLSQNAILDLESKLKLKKEKKNALNLNNLKLKKQMTINNDIETDDTNYFLTINNPIDMSIAGVNYKKPRVTVLSSIDLESEIPSENDDSDDYEISTEEKCFTIDFNVNDELYSLFAKTLKIMILSYNDYNFKGKSTFGYENIKKVEYFNNILEIYIDSNYLSYVLNNNKTDNLTTNNILTEELTKNFEVLDKFHSIDSETLTTFFNQTFFAFNKYDKNSILHKEVEVMTSLLGVKFCPDIFIRSFIKESKVSKMLIENISSINENCIPLNLSNQCEIVVRLYTSDNKLVLSVIEEGKFN